MGRIKSRKCRARLLPDLLHLFDKALELGIDPVALLALALLVLYLVGVVHAAPPAIQVLRGLIGIKLQGGAK